MSGWTDLPVSARGHRQIELLVERLHRWPAFDAIYTSPLVRAKQTALALAGAGLGAVHDVPALREIYCGEVEGIAIADVQRRFPDLWAANVLQDDQDFRWPGGESYRELRERSVNAIRTIAERHPGGRVAVVTHAGVISQIIGYLAGKSPARWELSRPANTALCELTWRGDRGRLITFDDGAHLAATSQPQRRAG